MLQEMQLYEYKIAEIASHDCAFIKYSCATLFLSNFGSTVIYENALAILLPNRQFIRFFTYIQ